VSSSAAVAAYFASLNFAVEAPTLVQGLFTYKEHRIDRGFYCCYDPFSRLDLRFDGHTSGPCIVVTGHPACMYALLPRVCYVCCLQLPAMKYSRPVQLLAPTEVVLPSYSLADSHHCIIYIPTTRSMHPTRVAVCQQPARVASCACCSQWSAPPQPTHLAITHGPSCRTLVRCCAPSSTPPAGTPPQGCPHRIHRSTSPPTLLTGAQV
jgi:hypothetical protein